MHVSPGLQLQVLPCRFLLLSLLLLHLYLHTCFALKVCVPLNSYVEALIPHVLVFGGGTLGRELELDEVMRVEPP